jgi:4-azaleucine resistance transporter AzlC
LKTTIVNKTHNDQIERKTGNQIVKGLAAALPICLGYVPIGLAFGVLAQKAGLSPVEIGLMSLLVYAGSSQFIGAAMLQAGAGSIPIIITTFFVNLRHFLMSSSLSIYLGSVNKKVLPLYAYGITDESFGVNLSKFREGNWGIIPALVVNHATNLTWFVSTVIGGIGGVFIPAGAFGIDFALIAMFLCLLVFQLRGRKYVTVALIAAGLSVVVSISIPGNAYIILASIIAATFGVVFKRQIEGKNG